MKSVVRLAIVDPDDTSRAILKNMLLGIDMVWLEAECSRYEYFQDVAQQTQPDIALVSLDSDQEKGLQLVADIKNAVPTCSVLVVSSSQEGSLILQAMRNGANEFLNLPLQLEDFMGALERIRNSLGGRGGESEESTSQMITVAGVSGGVGCTSLAINTGCMLAQVPRNSAVILDLDITLGDADVWLDIIPDYTIQDVVENIGRLDYSLLKRSLTKHDCGAFLLPRPVQIEEELTISAEDLRRFVALLKATFSHVVVDISKSFGPLDMAALEMSDKILLVAQLDLSSLRNVVRLMQLFDQREGLVDRIEIVVNRTGLEDSEISLNKALETIGREVSWQLPNEYATMVQSRNSGVPLCVSAPKAKLTRCIAEMVASFDANPDDQASDTPGDDKKKKKRLFSFLGQ